jgi:hypothetical protein
VGGGEMELRKGKGKEKIGRKKKERKLRGVFCLFLKDPICS